MFHLKNKTIMKIAIFAVITMVILWLLPVGLISAEGTDETPTETTVETTAETTVETTAETTVETTAETTLETTTETTVTDVTLEDSIVLLNPILKTDKEDYGPEETVIITGTGFAPNAIYTIVVVRPDGSIVIGDGSFTPGSDKVLTDAAGSFTYNYILDGIVGVYNIKAVDENGNVVATKSFTDCWARFRIFKYYRSECSDVALSGATFKIEYSSSSDSGPWTVPGWLTPNERTTDINGIAWFPNSSDSYEHEGYFKISEIDPPDGYTGSWSHIEHITSGHYGEYRYSVENTPISVPGTVIVNKVVQDPDGNVTDDNTAFEVTLNGETKPFSQDSPASFTVDPETYGATETTPINYDIVGNTGPVIVGSGETKYITITNKQKHGTIIVDKVVKDASGNVTDDNTAFEVTLNGETKPFSQNSTASFTVDPGTYGATETTPTSYDIVGNTGPAIVGCGETKYITITDQQKPGKITLDKTDATSGAALNGARFGLFLSDGTTKALDINGVEVPEVITGDGIWPDGYAEFLNIPWDNYRVIEVDPPAGYSPVDVAVTIDGDHLTVDLTSEIADPRIPGKIYISKEDSGGNALTGAGFTLFASDGTTVVRDEELVDAGGQCTFDDLAWDTYIVRETTVPAGFNGAADQTVTIGADNAEEGVSLTFVNTPPTITRRGSIEILKSPAVAGVGFTLYASDGTTVVAAEKFTDGTGKVTFSGLKFGTYIVRETTGIPGYSLAADQTVVVDSTSAISLTFTNTPPPTITVAGLTTPGVIQVLAFTGMDPIIPISGGSAIAGGLAMLIATLRRRMRK